MKGDLILSQYFIYALDFIGEIFQHPWREYIIPELGRLKNQAGPTPIQGPALSRKLAILFDEAYRNRSEDRARFQLSQCLITYQASEGNFIASLRTPSAESADLHWAIGSPGHTSVLRYRFNGHGQGIWLEGEEVYSGHLQDLKSLAQDGATLIGALALKRLLNDQSPFYRASLEHAQLIESMREAALQA